MDASAVSGSNASLGQPPFRGAGSRIREMPPDEVLGSFEVSFSAQNPGSSSGTAGSEGRQDVHRLQ